MYDSRLAGLKIAALMDERPAAGTPPLAGENALDRSSVRVQPDFKRPWERQVRPRIT